MMKNLTRNNKEVTKEDIDAFIQDLELCEERNLRDYSRNTISDFLKKKM